MKGAMTTPLGGFGSAAGLAGAIQMGVKLGMAGAEFRERWRRNSLDARGGEIESQKRFGSDAMWRSMEGDGIVGRTVAARNKEAGLHRRQEDLQQAEMTQPYNVARHDIRQQGMAGERGLRAQLTSGEASVRFGITGMREREGLSRVNLAAMDAELRNAGGRAGYSREAEQQDIGGRFRHEQSFKMAAAGHREQLGLIDTEQSRADAEVINLRRQLATLKQSEEGARASLGSGEGMAPDHFKKLSLDLEKEILAVKKKEEEIEQSLARAVSLRQQKGQMLKQQSQERVGLLQQRRDELSAGRQSEEARIQGMRENFGMMLPHQKEALKNLGEKVKRGEDLNVHERQFAQQYPEWFGDALKKQGARNAGPEFDEAVKLFGVGARRDELARQEAAISTKVEATINIDSASLSQQLSTQLVPTILQAIEQAREATQAQLRLLTAQRSRADAVGAAGP